MSIGDSIKINNSVYTLEKLTFYLYTNSTKKYYLIDLSDSTRLSFNVSDTSRFVGLGVDSTQTMQGVYDGDLDPALGMFWTWQTGYINLKVEYKDENNEEYQFHIGGYSGSQNTFRPLNSPSKTSNTLVFQFEKFVGFVLGNKLNSVMSPGKKAVLIADNYNSFFVFKP